MQEQAEHLIRRMTENGTISGPAEPKPVTFVGLVKAHPGKALILLVAAAFVVASIFGS